jgi:uncharacterized membrane protein
MWSWAGHRAFSACFNTLRAQSPGFAYRLASQATVPVFLSYFLIYVIQGNAISARRGV